MKKIIVQFVAFFILFSCNGQEKTDLSKLNLNEKIEDVINFNDQLHIGVETVEYPFSLLLEVDNAENYNFEGIDLSGQKLLFHINSEVLKTDSITRFGGGHSNRQPLKNRKNLSEVLKNYKAEDKIYGFRLEMNSDKLKSEILKKLETQYSKGNKNPNTENGLYWNIKKENKLIFYAPDYDRLIFINNTNLSKKCYWDNMNGILDFGGCDKETYMESLMKNATKPKDVTNKPIIKIDKNWNFNQVILDKTSESEFSKTYKNFKKMQSLGKDGIVLELWFEDTYHDFWVNFNTKKIVNGYSLQNLDKVDIIFDNGLKSRMSYEEILKLFPKEKISNYNELAYSNFIEIQENNHKITLNFDGEKKFIGLYVQ